MFTLFLGLGLLPIILDVALLILLIVLEENELFPGLFLLLPAAFTALYVAFGVNPFPLVLAHPFLAVGAFLSYFAIGVLWSAFSWWLYAKSQQPLIDNAWALFKKGDIFKDKPINEVRTLFLTNAAYNPLYRSGISLSNGNNWKIVNWIVLWPVSLVWRFTRSLTLDFGKLLLSVFGKFYDGIANSITNKLN